MMSLNSYQVSQALAQQLVRLGWRLAVAESCTGGGLAYHLTSVPGASSWFERGFVTYNAQAKQELLAVPAETILAHGEVSAETASAMALGVLSHSPADVSLSITGIAGPTGGSAEKPVGTVYFGLACRGRKPLVEWRHALFDGDRHEVRDSAIDYALTWLLKTVRELS